MSADKKPLIVNLGMGTVSTEWCETCQVSTVVRADVLILGDNGVSTVGTVSVCERCKSRSSRDPFGGTPQ